MDTDIDDSQTGTDQETPIEPNTGISQPGDEFSIQDEDTTTVDVVVADRLRELESRISDLESSLKQDTSIKRDVTYEIIGRRPTRRISLNPIIGHHRHESEEVTSPFPDVSISSEMYYTETRELEKLGEELYDQPQTVIYAMSIAIMIGSVYLANPLITIGAGLMLIVTAIHYAS